MESNTKFASSLELTEHERLGKLTSGLFEFDLTTCTEGLTVTLIEVASGKQQLFHSKTGCPQAYFNHMMSLTDELCDSWFNKKKQKKKKAAP